ATPKVWTFRVPQTLRSISLHSIIPRRTSACMWSARPALAKLASTRASVFPGPGPAARVSGIVSCGKISDSVIVQPLLVKTLAPGPHRTGPESGRTAAWAGAATGPGAAENRSRIIPEPAVLTLRKAVLDTGRNIPISCFWKSILGGKLPPGRVGFPEQDGILPISLGSNRSNGHPRATTEGRARHGHGRRRQSADADGHVRAFRT